MPTRNADVAVVVLNWKRYDLARDCLKAVRGLERACCCYLVDNESEASGLETLVGEFPEVVALPLEKNLGFAEGMNVGMERALGRGATHILLLNNDARVTPPLVDQLLAIYDIQKDAGVVGPGIRFMPPEHRVQSMGLDVNRVTGRIRLRSFGAAPDDIYPYPHKVDAVPGTAMMVRAELLQTVGMFDPGYFCYFEDVDLCLRARKKGLHSYIFPKAVVYHIGGATLEGTSEQVYYSVRNQLWVVDDFGLKLPYGLEHVRRGYVVGLHAAQLVREKRVGLKVGLSSIARGVRDYRAGSFGEQRSGQG